MAAQKVTGTGTGGPPARDKRPCSAHAPAMQLHNSPDGIFQRTTAKQPASSHTPGAPTVHAQQSPYGGLTATDTLGEKFGSPPSFLFHLLCFPYKVFHLRKSLWALGLITESRVFPQPTPHQQHQNPHNNASGLSFSWSLSAVLPSFLTSESCEQQAYPSILRM